MSKNFNPFWKDMSDPGCPEYFIRANSSSKKPALNHELALTKDNEHYLAWAFEHVGDINTIKTKESRPVLRGLFAFHSEDDISGSSKPLIDLIKTLRDKGTSVSLIAPIEIEEKPNQLFSGPDNISLPEIPLVEKLQVEFGNYVANGMRLFWYQRMDILLGNLQKHARLGEGLPENFGLLTILSIGYEFIRLLHPEEAELALEVKNKFLEYDHEIGEARRSIIKEGDEIMACMNLAKFLLASNIKRREGDVTHCLYVITPDLYWEFQLLLNYDGRRMACICPLSHLSLTAYTDGSELKGKAAQSCGGKYKENFGTFAGALITSTGHIVTHWRYRVLRISTPKMIELMGVIFCLFLSDQLRIPLAIRCDNYEALEIVSKIIKEEMALNSFEAQDLVDTLPTLKPLFPTLLSSDYISQCRLEWVRGHSAHGPNELVDFLAKLAYVNSEILKLEDPREDIEKIANTIEQLISLGGLDSSAF